MSALDGLRGVAIAAVLARHAFLLPAGGFGVDLFFVLSGFLITTLLLEEREATGQIGLRAFYARRARRLLPALLAFLATFVLVEAVFGHLRRAIIEVAAGGFYTANIFQAWWPHIIGRSPIGPLWSLAQEEQFYLLAPLALILILSRGRRLLEPLLVTAVAAVVIERIALTAHSGVVSQRIYAGPDTHADGLMVGMLLAIVMHRVGRTAAVFSDRRVGPAAAGLFLLLICHWWAIWPLEAPLVNLAAAGLVVVAVAQPNSLTTRALNWRPLVGLGRISYSLYLWNAAILVWLHGDAGGQRSITHYSATAAAFDVVFATIIAYGSWQLIEQPFRRRRVRSSQPVVVPTSA